MNYEGYTSARTDISAQEVPSPKVLGRLEAHVRTQLNGRIHDFCLSTREGGLVLNGFTCTYHAKQLAQHAIMEAGLCPIHSNDIEVN